MHDDTCQLTISVYFRFLREAVLLAQTKTTKHQKRLQKGLDHRSKGSSRTHESGQVRNEKYFRNKVISINKVFYP